VLVPIGDLDGDGARDLVVGEPEANRVHVLSGRDGSTRLVLESPDGASFGTAIATVGDVDRDGLPDLAVGDPGHAGRRGRVQVFSDRQGRLLYEVRGAQPGDQLGSSLAGGLDVDANGWAELVIGAPGAEEAGQGLADAGEVGLWSTWPASPAGHAHR
jgi:hypothetical protein